MAHMGSVAANPSQLRLATEKRSNSFIRRPSSCSVYAPRPPWGPQGPSSSGERQAPPPPSSPRRSTTSSLRIAPPVLTRRRTQKASLTASRQSSGMLPSLMPTDLATSSYQPLVNLLFSSSRYSVTSFQKSSASSSRGHTARTMGSGAVFMLMVPFPQVVTRSTSPGPPLAAQQDLEPALVLDPFPAHEQQFARIGPWPGPDTDSRRPAPRTIRGRCARRWGRPSNSAGTPATVWDCLPHHRRPSVLAPGAGKRPRTA